MQSLELYKAITENLSDGVFAIHNAKMIYVNPAFARMTGYDAREIIDKEMSFMSLVAPEDVKMVAQRYKDRLEGKNPPGKYVFRLLKKDQKSRTIVDMTVSIADFDGTSITVGVLKDITEEIKSQRKIEKSEKMLRNLVENQGEGVVIVDDNEVFTFANPAVEQILEVDPGSLVGMHISDFIPEKDMPLMEKRTLDRKSGKAETYEQEVNVGKGKKKYLLITSTPWTDDKNNYTGAFSIVRDITERKIAEIALKESEEKYKAALRQSVDNIYILDIETKKVVEANDSLARLLGYSVHEMLGMKVYDFVAHSKQDIDDNIDTLSKTEKIARKDRKYRKKNGEIVPVEVSGTIVKYSGGKALLVLSRDMTERIRAENKLKESENRLKELNATKDKFFSIIAHDLKNPLAAFKDATKTLKENLDMLTDEDIREFIDFIYETSNLLYSMLENLLHWSRTQTGRITFDPQEVDLPYLIRNTVDLHKMNAANKNIDVRIYADDELRVLADVNMLNLILRNLINNAIKFTPAGGNIEVSAVENSPGMISVSVADDGVGMNGDAIDKLFRIDKHYSTEGTQGERGAGLGLPLCKEFVEKNGGEISVESELGKGSKFTFTLKKAQ